MTYAICFRCGAEKGGGALGRCSACKAAPTRSDDVALSIALCEHLQTRAALATCAEDIRARRKLAIPPDALRQAREALQDRQLLAMLGMAADPANEREGAAKSSRHGSGTGVQGAEDERVVARKDGPLATALDQTPFGILDASTRDNRRRIVELAEAKGLTLEPTVCAKARLDLSNPRSRLAAEVAWLPGVSPKRTAAYRLLLRRDLPFYLRTAADENPLVRANLLAAAFDYLGEDLAVDDWAAMIYKLATDVDAIDVERVRQLINEDRAAAGFPEVDETDAIESEFSVRRRYYRDVVKAGIDRLPTAKMLDVVTNVVDASTSGGTEHGPILVDELVDSYEVAVRPFLDKEGANALALTAGALDSAQLGGKAVAPILDKLEGVIANWCRVARPIQVSLRARGMDHPQSNELAYKIRSLGIDLYNKHEDLDLAQRITHLLQKAFEYVPEVAERVEEDAGAIEGIFQKREQAKRDSEAWAREITYEAQIGIVLKDTLRISPNGIEWKGARTPLEAVTGIGWGATRNSVNGIPTGTDYFLTFCDRNRVTRIQTNRQQVFSTFSDKLWRAVGVRLMTEMLQGLRSGNRYQFGNAVLEDRGMELTKQRLFGADEHIRATWSQLQIWSANGALCIGVSNDKKAYLQLPYQQANNAHLLEAAIRMKFKNGSDRLSSILDAA